MKIRRLPMALLMALILLVASVGGSAAYWTADAGPNPARCGYWSDQIARGGVGASSAQFYFDHYNCTWVDPDDEGDDDGGEETPEDPGTRFRR